MRAPLDQAAAGLDTVSALQGFNSQVNEAGTASETGSSQGIFNVTFTAGASAYEAFAASAVFSSAFNDSASIFDTVFGAYLWNPVDGKRYSSKSAYYRAVKASGNVIAGDDPAVKENHRRITDRKIKTPGGLKDDLKRAWETHS